MNKPHSPLFDILTDPPAGGGGGGGNNNPPGGGHYDFRASLPEEIRGDPVFEPLKPKDSAEALALLGKGYREAQKMIGTQRLAIPQKDWKPEDWAKFNKALGVPESFDKYETPGVKLADGLQIIPEKLNSYKKLFHELGLRPDQAAKLQEFYLKDVNGEFEASNTAKITNRNAAMASLKEKYGDHTDAKLDIARSVLKKFGSEELIKSMTESGFGDNPAFVQMMVTLGENLLDDNAGGNGNGLPIGERAAAQQEIDKLKGDAEFQKILTDKSHPGQKGAVEKWLNLHRAAAGPQKQSQE